jgi:hypothetical protein
MSKKRDDAPIAARVLQPHATATCCKVFEVVHADGDDGRSAARIHDGQQALIILAGFERSKSHRYNDKDCVRERILQGTFDEKKLENAAQGGWPRPNRLSNRIKRAT